MVFGQRMANDTRLHESATKFVAKASCTACDQADLCQTRVTDKRISGKIGNESHTFPAMERLGSDFAARIAMSQTKLDALITGANVLGGSKAETSPCNTGESSRAEAEALGAYNLPVTSQRFNQPRFIDHRSSLQSRTPSDEVRLTARNSSLPQFPWFA
jgi:hypothetical protein